MRVVAVIQARTGSTRLPEKVLMDLAGRPMLARVVERVRRTGCVDETVVATTDLPGDDRIAALCESLGTRCVRGSEADVLDRYHLAARETGAEAVVRITSDCPLIDPAVVDAVVSAFLAADPAVDYASNIFPDRTYPRGLDTEVVSFAALDRAWCEDEDPALREHVTQYIQRHPDRFRTLCVRGAADLSDHRWTVDTAEDLELVRRVFERLGDAPFGLAEVLALLGENPNWLALNRHVRQKVV